MFDIEPVLVSRESLIQKKLLCEYLISRVTNRDAKKRMRVCIIRCNKMLIKMKKKDVDALITHYVIRGEVHIGDSFEGWLSMKACESLINKK